MGCFAIVEKHKEGYKENELSFLEYVRCGWELGGILFWQFIFCYWLALLSLL